MKFIYTPNKTDIIIYHENKILEEYSRIIKKYSNMFEQYDCSLEVRCFWHNCIQKKNLLLGCLFKMVIRAIYIVMFLNQGTFSAIKLTMEKRTIMKHRHFGLFHLFQNLFLI